MREPYMTEDYMLSRLPSSMAISQEDGDGCIALRDNFGFIITTEQLNKIYEQATKFLVLAGEEQVYQHNMEALKYLNQSAVKQAGKEKPLKKKGAGWVYVVGIVGDNLYKIGITTRTPDERLAEFVPKMPYEAEVIAICKTNDVLGMERKLHQMYDGLRDNGEWFRLNESELSDLKTYLENQRT
jgi:hypothetical protein